MGLAGGYALAYHAPTGWPWTGASGFWAASGAGLVVAALTLTWLAARVAREHVKRP